MANDKSILTPELDQPLTLEVRRTKKTRTGVKAGKGGPPGTTRVVCIDHSRQYEIINL